MSDLLCKMPLYVDSGHSDCNGRVYSKEVMEKAIKDYNIQHNPITPKTPISGLLCFLSEIEFNEIFNWNKNEAIEYIPFLSTSTWTKEESFTNKIIKSLQNKDCLKKLLTTLKWKFKNKEINDDTIKLINDSDLSTSIATYNEINNVSTSLNLLHDIKQDKCELKTINGQTLTGWGDIELGKYMQDAYYDNYNNELKFIYNDGTCTSIPMGNNNEQRLLESRIYNLEQQLSSLKDELHYTVYAKPESDMVADNLRCQIDSLHSEIYHLRDDLYNIKNNN